MKRGAPRHPKIADLCSLAKIRRPYAVGYLELLWHFTAEFAPQGDIGRFSDKRIESAVEWSGPAGKLVQSLTDSGWIDKSPDHRLVIHDWHEHADDSVKKKLSRSGLPFLSFTGNVTEQNPTISRHVRQSHTTQVENGSPPLPMPLPEPMPEPEPLPIAAPDAPAPAPPKTASAVLASADEQFAAFRTEYERTGAPFIDGDWRDAFEVWRFLDFEQKLAAVNGFRAQVAAGRWRDPARVKRPGNYLREKEYTRKPPAQVARAPSKIDAVRELVQANLDRTGRPFG